MTKSMFFAAIVVTLFTGLTATAPALMAWNAVGFSGTAWNAVAEGAAIGGAGM